MATMTTGKSSMRLVKKQATPGKVPAKVMAKATREVGAKATVVPTKPTARAKAEGPSRRDGTGHLDAKYAAGLRAMSLASAEDHTADRAFLRSSKTRLAPFANELGRDAVMAMTSAEDQSDQLQYAELELGEEIGGPFVPTSGRREFASGSDPSNPPGATREPFPKT